MEKFRWGNFDKYDMYVDRSYAPSVQSHQLVMRRAALRMLQEGKRQQAVDLIDKYFEAFPDMNFPYDYRAYYMISVYLQADAYDKAKPHMAILANEVADHLRFYNSIDPAVLESSFETDYLLAMRTKDDLIRDASQNHDTEFVQELQALFQPYQLQGTENFAPPAGN